MTKKQKLDLIAKLQQIGDLNEEVAKLASGGHVASAVIALSSAHIRLSSIVAALIEAA